MPANFPEAWVARVEQNLVNTDELPEWLRDVPEIANNVSEINGGSESEMNEVHIPTTDFEVDILINNNSYPIAVQQYDDDTITIKLDKYQTKQVPLSDDQVIGASYPIIDTVTGIMTTNINEEKYDKALHSMGPLHDTADTPVIETTGKTGTFDADGAEIILTDVDGRLRCTYYDLVALKTKIDKLPKPKRWPKKNRRLPLCNDHWNDLLLDRKNFGDKLVNYNTGDVAPVIAGFSLSQVLSAPGYDGTDKLAFGSALADGQYEASVAMHVQNIGKKTGLTKQYYSPAGVNPGTQANTVAYRHYFIVVPKRARYIAAIVSVRAEA